MLIAVIVISSIIMYLFLGVLTAALCYKYSELFREDRDYTITCTVLFPWVTWLVILAFLAEKGANKLVLRFVDMFDNS